MQIMKLVLWGLHHVQGFNLHQLRQPDHHIFFQGLNRCIRLHPSYFLATTMAIMPTKLVNATFLPKISFVIIIEKRDIRKQFWLPRQNLLTSSAPRQSKIKALQPSTQAFPIESNSNKNVKKKEHNVDKREVLQAHVAQV